MLVALQEVEASVVAAFRSCGISGAVVDLVDDDDAGAKPAAAAGDAAPAKFGQLHLQALGWTTGLRENGELIALATSLPEAVLEEQVQSFN